MATLKASILKELDALVFDHDDNDVNINKSYLAIATGIYNYLDDDTNYSWPIRTTLGIYASVLVASPFTPTIISITNEELEPPTLNLPPDGINGLKTLLKQYSFSGFDINTMLNFFTAVFQWLLPTTLTLNPPASVRPQTILPITGPHGPVLFPTLTTFGGLCDIEFTSTSFNSKSDTIKDDIWEIITNHIGSGLNTNVVPPVPTAGIVTDQGFDTPVVVVPVPSMTLSTITLKFNNFN